jgi:pimeloyl-ACP methyl ester carboxylesterase
MIVEETIQVEGMDIAVKINGNGPGTILLLHGSCMSSDIWIKQLEDEELTSRFRLIAFDLPGHGHSQKAPSADAYSPDNLAKLVKPVLGHYQADDYILAGLSLGSTIIGEISEPLPGCKGIMLVSPCVVNNEFPPFSIITPLVNGHVTITSEVSDEELQTYVYAHMNNAAICQNYISDYRNTDPRAREQLGLFMLGSRWSDELHNISKWKLPVCVVFGKDDALLKKDYLDGYAPLWRNKTILIEDAQHMVNAEKPELFNSILEEFAAEVFK